MPPGGFDIRGAGGGLAGPLAGASTIVRASWALETRTCPLRFQILHEHPADLCGFWPYAVYLSKRGLQALAIDLRCYGESACPQADDARSRVVDDVAGAVAALRAHGAKRVALVGASLLDTYSAARRLSSQSCSRWRGTTRTSRSSRSRRCIGWLRRGTSSSRSWAAPLPACTAGTFLAVATEPASPLRRQGRRLRQRPHTRPAAPSQQVWLAAPWAWRWLPSSLPCG